MGGECLHSRPARKKTITIIIKISAMANGHSVDLDVTPSCSPPSHGFWVKIDIGPLTFRWDDEVPASRRLSPGCVGGSDVATPMRTAGARRRVIGVDRLRRRRRGSSIDARSGVTPAGPIPPDQSPSSHCLPRRSLAGPLN